MSRVEGADISIQDFLRDNDDTADRKLQDVFCGMTVLLTGCTGFLGSVVLEKLLRSCPGIAKLILLIRENNDEQASLRYKTLCRTRLFDRIKMENPQVFDKVQVMSCEVIRPNLGLSQQKVDTITSSVNIIIHADILQSVDAGLKESALVNLVMTKHLLQLATKSRNTEAFVHVSSTLCHFEERMLDERFYTPPMSPEGLLAVVNYLPDDILEDITAGLLGEFPAPSILTQSVAEEIVRLEGKHLPLAVIRIPLLLATCKEPLAGWSRDSEVVALVKNILLGYIRTLHCQQNLLTELVPVDMAANLVIAAAGDVAKTRQEWVNKESEANQRRVTGTSLERLSGSDGDTTMIYNLVSSNNKPITWKKFYEQSLRHGSKVPFTEMIWYVVLLLASSRRSYMVCAFIFHILPAVLVDKMSRFFGKPSRMLKVYDEVQPTCDLVTFYATRQQRYRDSHVRDLWTAMSDSDQQVFDFNIKGVDWDAYFYTQCRGIRVYTLKDNLDTLDTAKSRRHRLRIIHIFIVIVIIVVILIIFFLLVKYFISKV